MFRRYLAVMLTATALLWVGPLDLPAAAEQRRPTVQRRQPPQRQVPPRYHAVPRTYYFPPVDLRLDFYYHPYFGFYYGPYYGPFYPFPGPFATLSRFSTSAVRTRVKPVEAEVYINGYYAGIVDDFDGVFQRLYVPSGEHEIALRLDGYEPFRRKVYVAPGDTFDLVHQMRPIGPGESREPPPAPRPLPEAWVDEAIAPPADMMASPFGVLIMRIQPADAQIVVDNEAWPAAQAELVIHLPAGRHHIEVRKDGFEPFVSDVDLTEGQTRRLNVMLQP